MIDLESTVVASGDQVSCDMDGEIVILNTRSGQYFGLNSVGSKIWALLQTPRTGAEILDQLQLEYADVAPDQIRSDLIDILDELVESGLIQAATPTLATSDARAAAE